ncbi:MAG TPA: hypothetical protein VJR89_17430 [Polyangiales bacterium]|nr:hypothetical protein [Polyangiales bacterium]
MGPARAQTQLEWEAPAGCPDEAAVRAGIERRLATSPERARLAPMRIDALVTREATRYRLELTLQTATGESHELLFAEDCALFARLIALQASLSAAPLTAASALPPRAHAARQREPPNAWSVRASGLVATTPLPAPAYGLGLGAALHVLPLRFELSAGYLWPREQRYALRRDVGGALSAWLVGLRACAVGRLAAVELAGCAGLDGAILRGEGRGVDPELVSHRFALAVSGGVFANLPLGRALSVWLGADLPLSLMRPTFQVQNLGLGALYRPPRLGVRGMLGLEVRVP